MFASKMKKPTSTTTSDSVEEMKKQPKEEWKWRSSGDFCASYDQYLKRLAEDSRHEPMDYWVERLEKEKKEAEAYMRQVKESDGFDIDRNLIPHKNHYVTVVPAYSETKSDERTLSLKRKVKEMAQLAIDYINSIQQAPKYEFRDVLKANYEGMGSALLYYITLRASAIPKDNNHSDDDQCVFQAKVLDQLLALPPERKVILFKIKGKSGLIRAASNAQTRLGEIPSQLHEDVGQLSLEKDKSEGLVTDLQRGVNLEEAEMKTAGLMAPLETSLKDNPNGFQSKMLDEPRADCPRREVMLSRIMRTPGGLIRASNAEKRVGEIATKETPAADEINARNNVERVSGPASYRVGKRPASHMINKDLEAEGASPSPPLKKASYQEALVPNWGATKDPIIAKRVRYKGRALADGEIAMSKLDQGVFQITSQVFRMSNASQLCEDLAELSLEKDKSEGLVTDLQRGVNLEETEMKAAGLIFRMSNVYASQLCEDLAELSLEKDKSEGLVTDLQRGVNLEEAEMKAAGLIFRMSNVYASQLCEDLAELSLEKDKLECLGTDLQRGVNCDP